MNYSTFSEIEHTPLRIYNRAVMSHNILEDVGRAAVEEYVKNFTKDERMEILAMTSLVKKHGPKTVKEWVTKGVVFPENMTEEEKLDQLIKAET